MRVIELKNIDGYDYKEMIKSIIENPGKRPYAISEVRQAVNILGKLENAESQLLLEQSEYSFVRDRLDGTEFIKATVELLEFVDTVQLAPEVDVTVKQPDHE